MSSRRPAIGILALILALLVTLTASGCGGDTGQASGSGTLEMTELRYQGFPGMPSFPELAEDLGYLAPIKLKWIGNTISGPQDIQAAATGQTDFGGAFNGAILKLKAAGAPIKAVYGYYGVDDKTYYGFYVLDGSPITSARDLIGKKVAVNTLGAHHEAMLKVYLHRNGLTKDEIKQVQLVVTPPVNTEQTLREKKVDVAVLGGILQEKAKATGGIHPVFIDYDLFGTFTAGSTILTERFIKKNPNTTRKFVEGVAKAIEWAQTHPRDEVLARFTKIAQAKGRPDDAAALKYWKSTGVAGKGGVIDEKEFTTWIEWLEREGELKKGQIRTSDLFTNQYNPYSAQAK